MRTLEQRRSERPYPCCREAENLTAHEIPGPHPEGIQARSVEVCACGRRHFHAVADPSLMPIRGQAAALGGQA